MSPHSLTGGERAEHPLVVGMLEHLTSEMGSMRESMGQIAEAVVRLARLEEKYKVTADTANDLEKRVKDLEIDKAQKDSALRVMGWMVKSLWAVTGGGLLIYLGKIAAMSQGVH